MKFTTKVINKRWINEVTLILRLERKNLEFRAGQYIILSFPEEKESREYSIYSGEKEKFIEILFKTVPEGSFSKHLSMLEPGDELIVDGPYGFFIMKNEEIYAKNHLFVATGTGISPFHSYIKTYPEMSYLLLHGIGQASEIIEQKEYDSNQVVYCISRQLDGHFRGRVTDYLNEYPLIPDTIYHLCGNSAMINDVTDILESKGVTPDKIRTEVFF